MNQVPTTDLPDKIYRLLKAESHVSSSPIIDQIDGWISARAKTRFSDSLSVCITRTSKARVSIRKSEGHRYLVWDKEFFSRFQQILLASLLTKKDDRLFAFRQFCFELGNLFLLDQGHQIACLSLVRQSLSDTKVQDLFRERILPTKFWTDATIWRVTNYTRLFAYLHEEAHHVFSLDEKATSQSEVSFAAFLTEVETAIDTSMTERSDRSHFFEEVCVAVSADTIFEDIPDFFDRKRCLSQMLAGYVSDASKREELRCDQYSIATLIDTFPPTNAEHAAQIIEAVGLIFEIGGFLRELHRQYENLGRAAAVHLEQDLKHYDDVYFRNFVRRLLAYKHLRTTCHDQDWLPEVGQQFFDLHDRITKGFQEGTDHFYDQLRARMQFSWDFWKKTSNAERSQKGRRDAKKIAGACQQYFFLFEEVETEEAQFYKVFSNLLSAPMMIFGAPTRASDLDLDSGITMPTSAGFQTLGEELMELASRKGGNHG